MNFFYNFIVIPFIKLYIKFQKNNEKLKNREKIANISLNNLEVLNISSKSRKIWFHSASMGEFEQARPIIENIKKQYKDIFIILTFFSPSGYDNLKDYKYADLITYLPLDYKSNVRKFINNTKPDFAIFIRYEIWYNYLNELNKQNIPIYLINASKPQNKYLNFYYKAAYSFFRKIYVMNRLDLNYFYEICDKDKVSFLPDTRFDRIFDKVSDSLNSPFIDKSIFAESKVLVAGSTWKEDEDIIIKAHKNYNSSNKKKLSLIIVPHEPTKDHINQLITKCNKYIFLSNISSITKIEISEIQSGERIIIVDSIGHLLKLYANAHIAYIGGAFGDGVHSVTEPAGYGIPLITGKDIRKSPDAIELNSISALSTVNNTDELLVVLEKLLNNKEYYSKVSEISNKFVKERIGSTNTFIKELNL